MLKKIRRHFSFWTIHYEWKVYRLYFYTGWLNQMPVIFQINYGFEFSLYSGSFPFFIFLSVIPLLLFFFFFFETENELKAIWPLDNILFNVLCPTIFIVTFAFVHVQTCWNFSLDNWIYHSMASFQFDGPQFPRWILHLLFRLFASFRISNQLRCSCCCSFFFFWNKFSLHNQMSFVFMHLVSISCIWRQEIPEKFTEC